MQVNGCSQPLKIPTLTQQDLLNKDPLQVHEPQADPCGSLGEDGLPTPALTGFSNPMCHCLAGRKLSVPCTYSCPLYIGS